MSRERILALAISIALGLRASAAAQAETATSLRLEVEGPSWLHQCLTQAELEGGVQSRGAVGLPEPLWVRVSTQAVEATQPAQLLIEVADTRVALGTRSIEVQPADCAALPDAVAIVVVLLAQEAESSALTIQPPPPYAPAPAPLAPTPATSASVRWPSAPPRLSTEDRPTRIAAATGMELLFGVLPQAGVGFFVEGGLGLWDGGSIGLRARYLLPQSAEIAEGAVRFAVYELSAELCVGSADYDSMRIGLRLCLGPNAGLAHTSGSGFRLQNRSEIDGMASVEGRIGASVALAPSTSLRLETGARLAVVRPQFLVRLAGGAGEQVVHAPGLLQTTVGLGLQQLF